MALRLNTSERIFDLVVPLRCPLERAYNFADQYEDWMSEKLSELPEVIPFIHNQVIPFDGMRVKLKISYDETLRRTHIHLDNNVLLVNTNKEDPHGRIVRWMKTYALQVLKEKSEEKSLYICKKIKNVSVRETKSRWGSCSSDRNLSYSWRLIFAPPEALDYVVAHEVAHLKHLDHSARFWAVCEELSDDYEAGKAWMTHNGPELLRYGVKSEPDDQERLAG